MLGIHRCKPQLAKALPGQARLDLAMLGRVGFGMVLHGPATVADGSTEPERALCCSLRRVDRAGSIKAGLGVVWRCKAVHGNSCRRQHRGLMLPLLLSQGSGYGKARSGAVS